MTTAAEFPVTVKGGQPLPEIRFGYVIKIPEKPVHRTLEQTIMIDAKGETVPVNTPAPAPAVAPNAVAAPTRAAPAAPATPSGPAGPGPDAPANPNS
jgi:hypothetical protein